MILKVTDNHMWRDDISGQGKIVLRLEMVLSREEVLEAACAADNSVLRLVIDEVEAAATEAMLAIIDFGEEQQ